MVDVVEQQARDRVVFNVEGAARPGDVCHLCIVGVEGQRDERGEASRFVLKIAKP